MIDVFYNKNRLFVFNTVENISYSPIAKYWEISDNTLLTDYFKSITDQLFVKDIEAHRYFNVCLRDYTNISKIHMYLYPITIAGNYYGSDCEETFKEAQRIKDLLARVIRRNKMFIMDKMNTKIGSVMKDYDRKTIRVVYHMNDKNFFETHDRKNDTICIYQITRPDPIIKRKM